MHLSQFLVRPPMREGESVDGWCWRIYDSNGYQTPPIIRAASKVAKKNRAELEVAFDQVLGPLLGSERLAHLRGREKNLLAHWRSHSRPRWYAWATPPRFCPLCISERRLHQLVWNLPLVTACGVHGCLLTDRCHSCGNQLNWANLRFGFECRCGAPIGQAPRQPAPELAIRFFWVLVAASDASITQEVKERTTGAPLSESSYQTRDVYEMLEWVLKMRRAITERRWYPLSTSWPMISRTGARMCPGEWELALINGLPWTMRSIAKLTLKGLLRKNQDALVNLSREAVWSDSRRFLDELKSNTNPLAALSSEAITHTLSEHSAGIPSQDLMLFNPKLSTVQRQQLVKEFNEWWCSFSSEVSTLDPVNQLDAHGSSYGRHYGYWGVDWSAALEFLNLIFHAAKQGVPPQVFSTLSRRWHLPPELQQPENPLIDLGGYLSSLHKDEMRFVTAMAMSATAQELDRKA